MFKPSYFNNNLTKSRNNKRFNMSNRVIKNKSTRNPVVIGFMNFNECPYCIEFKKTWEPIKSKNKNVVFVEMNKNTLSEDIQKFNNNKIYKSIIGNNGINIDDIETFPTLFYIENRKIKYYGKDDNNTDRNEKTIQKLINRLKIANRAKSTKSTKTHKKRN
jgi:thiol-disulfide isomerase/thioredoxin